MKRKNIKITPKVFRFSSDKPTRIFPFQVISLIRPPGLPAEIADRRISRTLLDCTKRLFFGNEKHKRTAETALFSYYQLFIKFLPLYSYTITKTAYTITETLILSRKLTGSFRVCIRVLPASIDFCVIVQQFPCEYPSFRDNIRLLPTSINYQAKEPQNKSSQPY